jgi:hypothetical protein
MQAALVVQFLALQSSDQSGWQVQLESQSITFLISPAEHVEAQPVLLSQVFIPHWPAIQFQLQAPMSTHLSAAGLLFANLPNNKSQAVHHSHPLAVQDPGSPNPLQVPTTTLIGLDVMLFPN